MAEIDWSEFNKWPESEITCGCGAVYQSHCKFVNEPKRGTVSRRPCPGCGRTDDVRQASSPPERMTIRG